MTKESDQVSELLDVIEFCEGALLDAVASEAGLDGQAGLGIAKMASDVLVKHKRTSVFVEMAKLRES